MYKVSNKYKELRYSGDNDNQLYLEYDGVEVENAPLKAENLKWTRRILDNGSTTLTLDNFVSQTIELTIRDYEVNDTTKEFYIKIASMVDGAYEYVPLGYYHIKDNPSMVNGQTKYKLTDRSTNFDKYIDLSDFIKQNNGKITKLQAVQEYCRQCDVEFANTSFPGFDEEIGIYDNTITARVHIMYLAECSGCIATIGRDGKLYFISFEKPNENNTHIIPERILNNNMNNSKGSFRISKVVWEGALMPFEKGNDTGDTLFLNTANPYISKQEDIDRIYEQVVGLEIDNISTNSIIGDPSIDPWDYIQYTHTDNNGEAKETFTSLAQYNLDFNGVFKQTFNTSIDREKKKINSTVNSDSTKIKRLRQEIDTVNGTLKVVSEQQSDINTQIGELTIKSDEISTKVDTVVQVDDEQESNDAILHFENINAGTPIFIHIHPIDEEIGDNFPTPYKVPKPGLTPKGHSILRFHNLFDNKDYDYVIPSQLRVLNNIYDELYMNYVNKEAYITRRIGVNEQGQLYLLVEEEIEKIPLEKIELTNGNYNVSLLGYQKAYLKVSLMIQNIYTTQFITEIQAETLIRQSESRIELNVSKKFKGVADEEGNVTSASIILGINNDESSAIIKADKVDLTGLVTITDLATSGKTIINGSNITTGTIDASKVNVTNLNANNITTGSLNASKVNITNLNADNITSGTITSSAINLGNGTFSVNTSGYLQATSGKIGGLTMDANAIYNGLGIGQTGSIGMSAKISGWAFWAGNGAYRVEENGKVHCSDIDATGGTFKGTIKAGNGSTIGGLTMTNGILSSNRLSVDAINGIFNCYNSNGGSAIISNAVRLSMTAGVGIYSTSNGNISAPSNGGIDIISCSGREAYIACAKNTDASNKRSSVTCSDGILKFYSAGYCTYNGNSVFTSSSLASKKNIIDLTQEQKEEVYELIKDIPLKQYDYKKQYGKKFNYGFIIEDIEKTKLKELLHITQCEENKDLKYYSSDDLTRLELIIIQELMKKIEKLESRINYG